MAASRWGARDAASVAVTAGGDRQRDRLNRLDSASAEATRSVTRLIREIGYVPRLPARNVLPPFGGSRTRGGIDTFAPSLRALSPAAVDREGALV